MFSPRPQSEDILKKATAEHSIVKKKDSQGMLVLQKITLTMFLQNLFTKRHCISVECACVRGEGRGTGSIFN